MRHIILALLASSTFYPAYSVDHSAPVARVVVSTPGKPVNIAAPVAKYASYIGNATASAYNSLNPFAGEGVQVATTDNTEYAPGSVASDFPGAKPRKVPGAGPAAKGAAAKNDGKPEPKYSMKPIVGASTEETPAPKAVTSTVAAKPAAVAKPAVAAAAVKVDSKAAPKTDAKPAPKYSMKPIVELVKDEPPEEFLADPEKAKVADKAKTKVVDKKAKPKNVADLKKDKKTEKPAAKPKKQVAVAAPHKAEPKRAEAEPRAGEIKAQVVKVEANEAAVAAAKAKVPEPRSEAAAQAKAEIKEPVKVEVKEAVKAETKHVEKEAEVEPKKVEAPKIAESEPEKVEAKHVEKEVEAPKVAKAEPAKVAKVEAAKNYVRMPTKAEFSKDGDVEKLKFTFSRPVAAAVFERFGFYWLVFYTDDKIEMPDIKNSQVFDAVKTISPVKSSVLDADGKPVQAPLIFSLEMVKNAYAMVQVKDNVWEVDFDPGIAFKEDAPLKLIEKPDMWEVDTKGLIGKVTVKDEFTNDYIEVVPLSEPGFNPEKVSNTKFIFEKTVQGMVFKPIGPIELKSPEKGRLVIAKDGGGPDKINVDIKKPDAQLKPLYGFQKWPQLKADDYRKAESKVRGGSALEFGKFLFSQSLYSEAAVNLQGERGFEASFLTGASYYMLGRFDDAIKVFDSLILPSDVDPNELLAWRAAASFELGQVNPMLAKPVELTGFYLVKNLDNYPDEIHNRLIFSITEKMIADRKYEDAQKLINMMPKTALETPSQSYMKYLQAKLYDGQNKKARAREIWTEVAKAATDRESQAKAAYEVIMQDYNGNKIKIDEAISKINDIRIMWRGDIFEYTMLGQLADMYGKNKQPYEALKTYKEILTSFPNFPHNLAIANTMRDIYAEVVTKNFADKEKTFAAVTIYYEFEELKPPGDKGDQITLQLADALARYDLLNDAVKILQKYGANLTDPAQKAEIGTRVAILQFLNNKPKDALQTLQDTIQPNLPNYLVQERRILQVRCLIEVGDIEKATSMLSGLPDEQANRFRADIYWKQKKWAELVNVYDLVSDKNDDDIMRIGIANVMLDDKKALQNMNKKYAEQMAKGQYADSFDYITDTDNVDFRDLTSTLKLDKTQSLLMKYRERIKNNGLAAVTGKNEPVAKPSVAEKPPEEAKK